MRTLAFSNLFSAVQASLSAPASTPYLVSALSQGVPCIGAGWSHKYPELFADYDCPDLLIKDLAAPALVDAAIDRLANAATRSEYRERISTAAARIKATNQTMWQEVERLIKSAL